MTPVDLKQHPIGAKLPPPTDEDYDRLKKSIEEHGFSSLHPIVLYEGMILDGYSRHLACLDLGVRGEYIQFIAPDMANSPEDFVWQEIVPRRHLTTGQRSALADERAAELLEKALDEVEEPPKKDTRTLTKPTVEESIRVAAKDAGVSPNSVRKARAARIADPGLAEDLKKGRKTLEEAKAAADKKNAAHGETVRIVDGILGDGWCSTAKLGHRELVKLSGIEEEEMKRIRPHLECGWRLDDALSYKSSQLSLGHKIQEGIDRAIESGRYHMLADAYGKKWEIRFALHEE